MPNYNWRRGEGGVIKKWASNYTAQGKPTRVKHLDNYSLPDKLTLVFARLMFST